MWFKCAPPCAGPPVSHASSRRFDPLRARPLWPRRGGARDVAVPLQVGFAVGSRLLQRDDGSDVRVAMCGLQGLEALTAIASMEPASADWLHQTCLDAWKAWSADVSASIAVATRSVHLALDNSDAEALAFAQARVTTLTERRVLVEASWPGLADLAATIPWMYFGD